MIYFASMGDVRKALDDKRSLSSMLGVNGAAASSSSSASGAASSSPLEGAEAHVFLADDEVVDDK